MRQAWCFVLVVVDAAICWLLWTAEVRWATGWAGTAWLSGFNWSAVPIGAVIGVSASYCVSARASGVRRAWFVGFACVASVVAFAIARWAAFELFAEGVPGRAAIRVGLAGGLLALLLVSVGLTMSASRWLAPLSPWAAVLLGGALTLVLPLSFATIKIFPAVNGSTDEIHAIKMGYPVLWTALLVPLAMRLGRRRATPK
jgi:hypothetical protein